MDRIDHVGSADPGNSGSSDGFSDGFEGVRKRLLGESASEAAAVVRAVRGVEIGGLMATVAAALPGSLTAAPAPELVASWSRGIGVLADGLVEHAVALGRRCRGVSQHGHGRSRGLRCPEMAGAFLSMVLADVADECDQFEQVAGRRVGQAVVQGSQWAAVMEATERGLNHASVRQEAMRSRSGVNPWATPQRTAWVRLATSILR